MKNLFRGLKPLAHPSRNVFDLSQKHVFTTRPGQVTPVMCLETVPKDHIEINMANLTRTMTLNTAAFIRGKFNFDFYFVPYSQLWHPFNQFIDQRRDQHTTMQKGFQYVPTISLGRILRLCWRSAHDDSVRQWSDDIFGYPWYQGALRLLDMLGYGSFYKYMTYPDVNSFNQAIAPFEGIWVNVFRIAAYQHIWYDIYRNKYFDVEEEYRDGITQYNDYVSFFNLDDIDCRTLAGSRLTETNFPDYRLAGLFGMRYCQYKRDLLTSCMPSTQFGAVSSVSFNNIEINNFEVLNGNYVEDGQASFETFNNRSFLIDSDGNEQRSWQGNIPNAFDVLQLRKAELLQRWKQSTLRAGNMVDDNFRAHYGVTPRYESDNNVLYLGSMASSLEVNPVTNQAESADFKTGDLGATGTAVAQGDKITFDLGDNGDFGVIMCVCYYTPESEYNSDMVDKANTLYEQFDFFTWEFENIGLEAVSRAFYDISQHPDKRLQNLGYAPRYWMYKTALDKVHGEFRDSDVVASSLRYWVAPRFEQFYSNAADKMKLGTRGIASFYVDPAQLNNVFSTEIRPDTDYDVNYQMLDPFLHNVFFDVKAVRPMSVLGLPQF